MEDDKKDEKWLAISGRLCILCIRFELADANIHVMSRIVISLVLA